MKDYSFLIEIFSTFKYTIWFLVLTPTLKRLASGLLDIWKAKVAARSEVRLDYQPYNRSFNVNIVSGDRDIAKSLANTLKELNSSRKTINSDSMLLEDSKREVS